MGRQCRLAAVQPRDPGAVDKMRPAHLTPGQAGCRNTKAFGVSVGWLSLNRLGEDPSSPWLGSFSVCGGQLFGLRAAGGQAATGEASQPGEEQPGWCCSPFALSHLRDTSQPGQKEQGEQEGAQAIPFLPLRAWENAANPFLLYLSELP